MERLNDTHEELAKLKLDRDRLDWLLKDTNWLLKNTSFLSGIKTRADIDKAMNEEWFERERHDKIMSGM